jgi:hypothetical protein
MNSLGYALRSLNLVAPSSLGIFFRVNLLLLGPAHVTNLLQKKLNLVASCSGWFMLLTVLDFALQAVLWTQQLQCACLCSQTMAALIPPLPR